MNSFKRKTCIGRAGKLVSGRLSVFIILMILVYTGILNGISGTFANLSVSAETTANRFNYDFIIKDLEGNKINFTAYKGQVVFLNLWATWCGPCRAEMPGIQGLYNKLKNENIRFVMLSIDQEGHQPKVKKYITDKQFTFPVFMPSGPLTPQLTVPSIPTTFIINKQGMVVQKITGTTNFDTPKFKKYLEELASE